MKKELNFKILVPHREDCRAVKNTSEGCWDSPWFFSGFFSGEWGRERLGVAPEIYRDTRCRKNGMGRKWLVFACNSSIHQGCRAQIAVREGWILSMLPMKEPTNAKR